MGWLPDILGTLATMFRVGRATLDSSSLTANRTLSLPDASGTLALTAGNDSLAATEIRIRTVSAGASIQAGDQCILSGAGASAPGRFPLVGASLTAGDDRVANKYVRFASGRILAASAKLYYAAGLGAAVLDPSGTTVLATLSTTQTNLYRITDDVWYLSGAALIYDDGAQQTYAAPTTLHQGAVIVGGVCVHDVVGGFGAFDLTAHTALSVTVFPLVEGEPFTIQGWAASGGSVCVVGTVTLAGTQTAHLYEYDLTGTFVQAVALGCSGVSVTTAIQPASTTGHFFVGCSADGVNGDVKPYGGGVLGASVHGFGRVCDSIAIWTYDGTVHGYAVMFELFDDPTTYTAYWTGSDIAVSTRYDWTGFPVCMVLRSPAGTVFALADDGVPQSTMHLIGISITLSGAQSQPKQPFAVTPAAAGLYSAISPRHQCRGLCEPPVFSGSAVTVKGIWGVNGLVKGLAADAYTMTEVGAEPILATALTLADMGSVTLDTPMYNAYGWRCSSDGRLIDLSRSIDGTWHLLDGTTLTVTGTASLPASTTEILFVDRVADASYLAATRVGLRLGANHTMTTRYAVVMIADPTSVPDSTAVGVALTDAEPGQPVEVLLWGSATLAIPDGAYACGVKRCFVASNRIYLI